MEYNIDITKANGVFKVSLTITKQDAYYKVDPIDVEVRGKTWKVLGDSPIGAQRNEDYNAIFLLEEPTADPDQLTEVVDEFDEKDEAILYAKDLSEALAKYQRKRFPEKYTEQEATVPAEEANPAAKKTARKKVAKKKVAKKTATTKAGA